MSNGFRQFINTFFLTFLCFMSGYSDVNNVLGPNARLILSPDLGMTNFGFSLLGEGGERTGRGSGTFGFYVAPQQRLKIGVEYLTQGIQYKFNPHRTEHWVQQVAAGGEYQILFDSDFFSSINFGGFYSHAPSHKLKRHHHNFEWRRIAGSNAYDVFGGISITPWNWAQLTIDATYDHVTYNRKFDSNKKISGVGVDIELIQNFSPNIYLALDLEIKRPYREFGALLNFHNPFDLEQWDFGIYITHLDGRGSLPTITSYGLHMIYSFGIPGCDDTCNDDCRYEDSYNILKSWVSKPAVYMPTVLAIPNSRNTQLFVDN